MHDAIFLDRGEASQAQTCNVGLNGDRNVLRHGGSNRQQQYMSRSTLISFQIRDFTRFSFVLVCLFGFYIIYLAISTTSPKSRRRLPPPQQLISFLTPPHTYISHDKQINLHIPCPTQFHPKRFVRQIQSPRSPIHSFICAKHELSIDFV